MVKIAIDIALLLPEKVNKLCREINQREHAEAFSDLAKSNNNPHITLAMGVIDKEDIKQINEKLKNIIKDFSKLDLEIVNIFTEITPENKKSCCFEIRLTKELKNLHSTIMNGLLPLFSYNVEKNMFFLDPDEIFKEVSKYWVANYGKNHSNPNRYHPHISLKCRNAEYSAFPLKLKVSKVALCHLGNYCTCRTILGSHELGQSFPKPLDNPA